MFGEHGEKAQAYGLLYCKTYMRVITGLGLVLASVAFGQSFEISDVRVSAAATNPDTFASGGLLRGGRYDLRRATMVDLIRIAWGVDPDIAVDLTPDQLNDLVASRRNRDIIRPSGAASAPVAATSPTSATASAEATAPDTQLETSLLMMRLQLIQSHS